MAVRGASLFSEKVYMRDSTLRKWNSEIAFVSRDDRGAFFRLKETIFHPQGGGQPFDVGAIKMQDNRAIVVWAVHKEEMVDEEAKVDGKKDPNAFRVNHYYRPENAQLEIGDQVEMEIEGPRRELSMRLHSAGHLIAALVEASCQEWKANSGHHVPKEANVKFALRHGMEATHLAPDVEQQLKAALPEAIAANSPVHVSLEGGERTVAINGHDPVPCGGTHVPNIGMIEGVEIRKVQIKKNVLQVSYDVTKKV